MVDWPYTQQLQKDVKEVLSSKFMFEVISTKQCYQMYPFFMASDSWNLWHLNYVNIHVITFFKTEFIGGPNISSGPIFSGTCRLIHKILQNRIQDTWFLMFYFVYKLAINCEIVLLVKDFTDCTFFFFKLMIHGSDIKNVFCLIPKTRSTEVMKKIIVIVSWNTSYIHFQCDQPWWLYL